MKILLFDRNNQKHPYWWDNFMNDHRLYVYRQQTINDTLKPYGGRFSMTFCDNGYANERWLEFEREEQYTWFVLRFSS